MAAKGGKILKESPITLGKYKGREYLMDVAAPAGGRVSATVRLYVTGNGILMLMVTGSGPLPSEGSAFFNSLMIGN
jgi:hypothetical protein